MGREVKRVPLDFSWPIDKTYDGYLNPFYKKSCNCPDCDGTGESPFAKSLTQKWYGYLPFKPEDNGSVPITLDNLYLQSLAKHNAPANAYATKYEAMRLCKLFNSKWMYHLNDEEVALLAAEGSLKEFTHTYSRDTGKTTIRNPPYIPTAIEVNNWSISSFAYSSSCLWLLTEAECAKKNVPHECQNCIFGAIPKQSFASAKAAEDLVRVDPPKGDGYQIWQTVSEGAPISPVFPTPEALAEHMKDTRWGADDGTSYNDWLKFIQGPGWAPSMILMSDGSIMTGVQAI